ncbi:MAG: hypothetical protein GY822_31680 [Deltaproteobacteria bacterium]|nr:hypothetical protein [Deltaproteobacteria bacterium]
MKENPDPNLLTQGPRAWARIGLLYGMWTVCFVVWDQARPMQADIYARFQQGFIRTWWDKDWVNVLTGSLVATLLFALGFAIQAQQQSQFSEEKVPRSYFFVAGVSLFATVALRLWVAK